MDASWPSRGGGQPLEHVSSRPHDNHRDDGPRTVVAWTITLGAALCFLGCADPCFDDGLAQGGCPSDGATDGGTGGDDFTATFTTATESDSETDPTAATATGGSYECPELDEVLEPQTPTIQLVVDQSGSLQQSFGGITRWEAIVQTLVDPADGIVTMLQSEIRFGLTLYTNDGKTCPTLQELVPQLDAGDEITQILEQNSPLADTPTGESLETATAILQGDNFDGDKFLLLATDGEPDTCAQPNPMTEEEIDTARSVAVQAVADAYAANFETFVVSVGDQIAAAHLQEMANAGAGVMEGDEPATFYTALDQASLAQAFTDIIAGVRDCDLDLPKPLTPDLAPSCTVTVNDTEVPYEDPNGWMLDGENAIELQGDACTAIQNGVVSITMNCTCEVSS